MAYKISGRVLYVGEPQTLMSKSGSSFTKRDLVIAAMMYDQYTGKPTEDAGNTPKFVFINDKARDLDSIAVGETVTIHFDIAGRRYEKNGKVEYFTDVRPFRVDRRRGDRDVPSESVANTQVTQASFGHSYEPPF